MVALKGGRPLLACGESLMAQADPQTAKRPPRPLSPHITIYRRESNMVMSILHRITGAALYFGTLLLAWFLVAAASGPQQYAFVSGLLGSPLGLLVLFGFTWAFMHHLLGGVRHLIWDTGHGFDLSSIRSLSLGTLIGSVVLTVIIWIWAIAMKGGV
jgi:succinate dehydrogenase / fumarate reductase cytochrome b subunit